MSGIAAPVVFAAVAGILGAIQTGYNPVTQLISELGETGGSYAGIMNVGFGLTGMLIILFSYRIFVLVGKSLTGATGSFLVVLAGISFVTMAIFSCDTGCIPVTSTGQIHLQLGILALLAAVSASLLIGYSMWKQGTWNGYWQYSMASGVLVLILVPLFISVTGPDGLIQRVMIGIIFLWMEILAIKLYFDCRDVEAKNINPII
jgi:hypothetical membrane protein